MKETIKNEDLILNIEESDHEIRIEWSGKSTERDPSQFLTPLFNDYIETRKNLVMDFKSLEYMNSSTITPILKVIDRLKARENKLLIIYAKNLKWQHLSFSALEIFKSINPRIEIIAE